MAQDYLGSLFMGDDPIGSFKFGPLGGGANPATPLWNQLNDWLGTLSSSDRSKALTSIKQWYAQQVRSNPLFANDITGFSAQDLQGLANTLQKSYGTAKNLVPGATPPATKPLSGEEQKQQSEDAVQSSAVTAATTVTPALPDTAFTPTGGAIPVEGAVSGTNIPGTTTPASFNNLLQNYYQTEFATAGDNVNQLAQLAGLTPQNLQSQYQSYVTGWNKVTQPGAHARNVLDPGEQVMSLTQFAQNKASAMIGPWASVLSAISGIWQSQYNQALPPDLATQIITALNQMPPSQQSNVLVAAMSYMTNYANSVANKQLFDQTGINATTLLQLLPSSIGTYTQGAGTDTGSFSSSMPSSLLGKYANNYPSAFVQQGLIQTEIANAFQSALNRAPTTADVAALGSDPTTQEIKAYIDNQPAPGMPGMTYGAYSSAVSALTPQWQEYFGRDPNAAELRWSVGKSPEDLQSFINNSSSSIPGITIGQKNDYESFIDGLDRGTSGGHGLSAGIDDSLISDLHSQITKASTGTAKPGAM